MVLTFSILSALSMAVNSKKKILILEKQIISFKTCPFWEASSLKEENRQSQEFAFVNMVGSNGC